MFKGVDQQKERRTNALSRSALTSDEMLLKLQSLTKMSESQSNSKPLSARDLEHRLVQIRAEIAEILRKEAASFCDCKQITVIAGQTPEEFEAELKVACPVHGLRILGIIIQVGTLPPDDDDRRIRELIKTHLRSITGVRS